MYQEYPGYIPAVDFSTLPLPTDAKPRESRISKALGKVSIAFAILGAVVLVFSFAPSVFYRVSAQKSNASQTNTQDEVKPLKVQAQSWVRKISNYQPPKDFQTQTENRIKIQPIGVDTEINEATEENFESALKKGVWRDPSFGTAYDRSKPLVLAAHRFGYLEWSNTYRHLNSFYNLPKLEKGDVVEITWNQRRYVYAIYGVGTSTDVQDYSADLILYTCEDLNSSMRVFAYGRLLEI